MQDETDLGIFFLSNLSNVMNLVARILAVQEGLDGWETAESFSQLSLDIAISRIFIGYQFRNDVVQGEKMGRELAKYVFKNNLRILR